MTLTDFEAFADDLRARLAAPLPGAEAQVRMAPAYRADPSVMGIDGKDCREAGVLAFFYPAEDDGTPRLVLTVRRDSLADHAGQISFPGGQRENGEALRATALREAHEEVGLDPARVDVLGALTPLYIPPSGFCVHPFVGICAEKPPLRPTDAEVKAILRVPLAHLLDPTTLRREDWTLQGRTINVPFFAFEQHTIWGATAMMLAELLAAVEDSDESSKLLF